MLYILGNTIDATCLFLESVTTHYLNSAVLQVTSTKYKTYWHTLQEKIEALTKKIYGGDGVNILPAAKKQIEQIEALGFGKCPICVAKTQYSLSDDPTKLGAPSGFTVTVKAAKVSAGAGFVVVYTGDILTMPGLPKVPAAEKIDVDDTGRISGLF